MSGTVLRKRLAAAIAVPLLLHCGRALAETVKVERIRDVWPALSRCWTPPTGSDGMQLTVRFSVKRTGELIGAPRVTYSRLRGSAEEQRLFRDSVLAAVQSCTPLPLSQAFGEVMAGKPLSVRFIAPRNPGD